MPTRSLGKVIKVLGSVFRGMSFVVGITAPSPDEDQGPFVFLWLGIIACLVIFSVLLFFVLSRIRIL